MSEKIVCKYGENCYRKSEEHLSKYSHPDKNDEDKQISLKPDSNSSGSRRGSHSPRSKSPAKPDNPSIKSPESIIRATRGKRSRSGTPKKLDNAPEDELKRTRSKSPPNRDMRHLSPEKSRELYQKLQKEKSPLSEKRTGKITSFFKRKSPAKKPVDPTEKKIEDEDLLKPQDTSKMNFMEYMNYSERRDLQVIKNQNKELLKNPHEFIKYRFLVTMPPDFYTFWDWCKKKCNDYPANVFTKFGFDLIGPFDVLAGKFNEAPVYEPGDYLRHYRFFYDTPEFQTIFIKTGTGVHYGYWRDEPLVDQCFVAKNDQTKGCQIDLVANNAFSAAIHLLKTEIDPDARHEDASKFIEELTDAAKEFENFGASLKKRNKKVVCKTFHKAGLVVPYDHKTTVGYRELQSSDVELKNMLRGIDISLEAVLENLQPLITAANIAVDEGDFGNTVELGIDLFCYGKTALHDIILQLLVNGYMMLKRPQFLAIMKSHLANRIFTGNLNILQK